MHVPDYVPLLRKGTGSTPDEGGCLVQIANWLVDPETWTDEPICVNPTIAWFAIRINDCVGDAARHRLALMAPRISDTRIVSTNFEKIEEAERQLRDELHVLGHMSEWQKQNPPPMRPITVITSKSKDSTATSHVDWESYDDEALVTWFEQYMDEWDSITGRSVEELPVERWEEIKELVGQ